MRKNPTKHIEQYRLNNVGAWSSDASWGANGAFEIPHNGVVLRVIASDGSDWRYTGFPDPPFEHVSVSLLRRCPTWEEMEYVKRIFWRDDETVIQYHVPRSDHVNRHEFCLHLWKPVGVEIVRPPAQCVG